MAGLGSLRVAVRLSKPKFQPNIVVRYLTHESHKLYDGDGGIELLCPRCTLPPEHVVS